MSTRSYVGIIENGRVWYGYHHSDSHLESMGIDLYKEIKTKEEAWDKILRFTEIEHEDTMDSYFATPDVDISIEFCYGFDVDEKCWYVSSCHFSDAQKIFKLADVVKDNTEMARYADMYYPDYRRSIITTIREAIAG